MAKKLFTDIKFYNSIGTKLLFWFILVSVIPFATMVSLNFSKVSKTLIESATNELTHETPHYIHFINNWFFYRETDLTLWSQSKTSYDFLKVLSSEFSQSDESLQSFIHSSNYKKIEAEYANDFIQLAQSYDYIYDIFILDNEGNILYTVDKEEDFGTNLITGKYAQTKLASAYKKTLTDGKMHFSDLERYGPSNNGIYGFLTAPIITKDSKVKGVLALQIRLTKILEQFKNGVNNRDHSMLNYLIGDDNLLRTKISDTSSDEEILHRKVSSNMHKHTQGEFHKYTNLLGEEVYAIHNDINIVDIHWELISEVKKEDILKDILVLKHRIQLTILLTFSFIILIVILLSRRITAPLKRLSNYAHDITINKNKKLFEVEGSDEIAQLAQTLNTMIKKQQRDELALIEKSKLTQEALYQLQEQKFALDAHSIVAITDVKGTITYVNDKFCEISGFERSELIGSNHRIVNSGYHSKEFWQEAYKTISSKKVFSAEICNVRKDGEVYWVKTTIVPFIDKENNTIKSYIALRNDITKQKKITQELMLAKEHAEIASSAKANFLASMSHEIRTPMNGVIGMLGLLEKSSLNETQQHQLSIASSSASSLLSLINDILDFSKIEAGKMDIESIEFNLIDDLGNFTEAIAFKAQEQECELILDLSEVKKDVVITDPSRLRQIMTNLVGNAIKFTQGGQIIITVNLIESEDDSDRLHVSIEDSGIGIPSDKLSSLFDSFSQVDSSTTRKYGGTGLGLSIVKKLVELMGGYIQVESVEGVGSTFSFEIDISVSDKASAVALPSTCKDAHILIVDNNEASAFTIKSQLQTWGIKSSEVSSTQEALAFLQEHYKEIDIVIVDMYMDEEDAFTFASSMRNIPEYDSIKLALMHSISERTSQEELARLGFNVQVPKPIIRRDYLNILSLLDEDHTREEIESEEAEEFNWPEDTRILLVEDNLTNQLVANGILEEFELEADVAKDGAIALEMLKEASDAKRPFTLILMDCQMPVLDGYDATEAIRKGEANEENKNLPIIAMTANAMASDKERCLASGMDDFIAKPIDADFLLETLKKYL